MPTLRAALYASAASLILAGMLAVGALALGLWHLLDRFGPKGETWTVTCREIPDTGWVRVSLPPSMETD